MGRVTITEYGIGRKHPDDTWTFPRGRPDAATVEEDEVVGFRYQAAGRGEAVSVEVSVVFHPEDETRPPVYRAESVMPRTEYFQNAAPPPGFFEAGIPLRASFAARSAPRGRPDTASLRIVPASIGRFDSGRGLAPATDAAIVAFETRFRTALRLDYRAFLKDRNGLDLVWWRDPRWNTAGSTPGETDDHFYDALIALEPGLRETLGADWEGARKVYGIGTGHPDLDIAARGGDFHFYRAELMRHAYIVAVDGGGNNFVQVVDGRHAGRVLGVDHETYYGGLSTFVDFEDLDDDARADLPWTDLAQASTDAVIDKGLEYGFLLPIADDFTAFLDGEVAVANALIAALAPAYRRD